MSGYIKCFENGGKNMSFIIKDDNVLDKYNKKYIEAKVREFTGVIKTNFLSDEMPKKGVP